MSPALTMRPSRVSDRGVRFVAGWEGLRLHPYNDANGFATVGYGHLIARRPVNDDDLHKYSNFTQTQAQALLREDLRAAELAIVAQVRPPFGFQWRFDAIASAVFNLGPGILEPSHTLGKALASRSRRGAADALLLYDHDANGHELPGLLRRRQAERRTFLFRTYA